MRTKHGSQYIAQAALIGAMLLMVDFGLFEALRHMFR
jgi:hypothetical protein